jgi:hypothetical protein
VNALVAKAEASLSAPSLHGFPGTQPAIVYALCALAAAVQDGCGLIAAATSPPK